MRNTAASVLTAALAALAFAAPARAQEPSMAIDPCRLLSVEEVSAVMGEKVQDGQLLDNGFTRDGAYSTTCLWTGSLPEGVAEDAAKPLGGRPFAMLNVMNWLGGPDFARKFLTDFEEACEAHEIPTPPVAVDVGADEALWWGDGVAAREGGVSIGVSVAQIADRNARQPKAEDLARTVVPRLPKTPA